jgi:hypothetical protein
LTILRRFAAASLLPLAAGAAACTSSTATSIYTPVTGIQIPSATVVAGYGCGTGAGQVYRYAAVISTSVNDAAAPSILASSVFPCFADGVFSNLPVTVSNQQFRIAIYAYNQASFPAALDCTSSPCPGDDAGAVASWSGSANWTTTCTGTEIGGVTALATCAGLQAPGDNSSGPGADSGADGGGEDGAGNEDANEEP